ncbi:MAG: signal peptidase I [Clostridia bacterium]|nr:signal peptidase I [Clostridia bacterium]NLS84114.1 signal peptidase I [Oscillospiraceae bacterium]
MEDLLMAKENKSEAFEWFDSIVFGLTVAMCVLVFFFNFSNVNGSSMFSTLSGGDRVLERGFLYTPQRGDIVTTDALISHGKPLAKRVIALEGDTVDISGGVVTVNGETLDESYLKYSNITEPIDVEYPVVVPEGKVFLMGDNRENSLDSRASEIGFIDTRDIQGKVIWRVAPNFGKVE